MEWLHEYFFVLARLHLRQVEPVMLNSTPRFKVTADKVSITLIETLL